MIDHVKKGKKSRRLGKEFEVEVRKDLEKQGWIVSKWSNQIKDGKIVPAKGQYNPFFKRIVGEGSGFPDFICFRKSQFPISAEIYHELLQDSNGEMPFYEVIGVESKMKGKLDKIEKEKCAVYFMNKTFSKILIASKCAEGVKYEEFK